MAISWKDKKGHPTPELEFVIDAVIKRKIHPNDLIEIFYKRFNKSTTASAFRSILALEKISIKGLVTKAEKNQKPKTTKQKIKADVEKHKLQEKFREVDRKYKMIVREESISDRMVRVLRAEARALPKVDLMWEPPSQKVTQETAVLLLSDLHLGEIVDRDVVCGFGEYNFDIFNKRLKFLAKSMRSIIVRKLTGYKIDKLCIFGLGDMVSGRIHDELIENSEDIIFQIMNGAFITAQFVLELAQMFPEIEIDGVLGNHGRIIRKKYYKRRYTNWDFVFYQFLGMFLAKNKRIKCNFPKSFFVIKKIRGWTFLLIHGDNIRSWMGIPWYGIERMMWKLGDLLKDKGTNVNYRILGHFHNTGELDRAFGELIINGSMIGGTEFSLMSIGEFNRPTQLFFGVHTEIGMTWRYPLRLDLKGVEEVTPYKYNQELNAIKYMQEMLKRK